MATFTATITYPDAKAADLRDTLCNALEYDKNKIGAETKAQFIQREANDFLRRWIKNTYERQKEIIAQQAIEKLDATI